MHRTEMRNPRTTHIDRMSTMEMMQVMQDENMNAAQSVQAALPQIAAACDRIAENMKKGGRMLYLGAGTSGRLAVVDASEAPPTYGVSPDTIIGIMAGGMDAMFRSKEGVEDDGEAGVHDLCSYDLRPIDSVVGISAAGNAMYVVKAINYARALGCPTVSITCNEDCKLVKVAEIAIVTDTGPEVVTGSTRMKAGTAQKLVLNMLSTGVMIRCGRVYENLMVYLEPTNVKLRARMINIVSELLECDKTEAEGLLDTHEWSIPYVLKSKGKM